ncbi:MAG TPA: hypothetical protein VL486_13130 [Verrucomicrobiae bacterium]|nr:hypothetical protein [Verrucomicrobiae bacterium]
MKKRREPEALRELHRIREQIYREAKKAGLDRYYGNLDQKAGWLLGKSKKTPRAAAIRERRAKYKAR